jgi:hypothetical protein
MQASLAELSLTAVLPSSTATAWMTRFLAARSYYTGAGGHAGREHHADCAVTISGASRLVSHRDALD